MQEWWATIRDFFSGWDLSDLPPIARIGDAMDPVAWTLVGLLGGAVVVGIFFSISTRRSFGRADEIEATPDITLAVLKKDPERLPPVAIVSRLGADATLELLEYGDQVPNKDWRYRWRRVREELIALLARQDAFGPTYALSRYYRSADTREPDTLRIRRTALIHKLGLPRYLEPDADGGDAELRIRCHPAEVQGDLGFNGNVLWLLPDEPAPPPTGPMIEMEPVDFRTLHEADVRLHIRRSPVVGGGFTLHLVKRRGHWVIVDEEIEWVS